MSDRSQERDKKGRGWITPYYQFLDLPLHPTKLDL